MKRVIIQLLFLAGVLLACTSSPDISLVENADVDDTNLELEDGEEATTSPFIEGKASVSLVSSSNDSTESTIEYTFYADENEDYKVAVNNLILSFLSSYDFGDAEDEQEPKVLSEETFTNYLKSFADEYKAFQAEEFEGSMWSLERTISVDDNFDGLVQVFYSGWSYTGGAHGNGFSNAFIINKKNNNVLLLEDVVTDVNELVDIALPYFREQNLIEPGQSLEDAGYDFSGEGEEGFHLNNNFHFSENSLNFHFNSYEIAPYVVPPSDITIPLSDIKHLLKFNFND